MAPAAVFVFSDGVTANCFFTFDAAQYQSLIVTGETGLIQAPRPISASLVGGPNPGPARSFILEQRDAEQTVIHGPPLTNTYEEMMKSFKRSVSNGEPALVTGEEGSANLRAIEA